MNIPEENQGKILLPNFFNAWNIKQILLSSEYLFRNRQFWLPQMDSAARSIPTSVRIFLQAITRYARLLRGFQSQY
jgi:hypothetical protein